MIKNILLAGVVTSTIFASTARDINRGGVDITHTDQYDTKANFTIKRDKNPKCKPYRGMDPTEVWGGDHVRADIPKECKKTFLVTVGILSPMKITDGVLTVGELEVIEYMKKAQNDQNLLLVDARTPDWYNQKTIPTAINLPFTHFNKYKKPDEFEELLDTIGVEIDDDGNYNFDDAKTMLLFCNGIWCPQSVWAIEALIEIGYPKEKLLWYRGGMTSWSSVNLSTIKP
jgi:rhodanese-related sulfurtransferase